MDIVQELTDGGRELVKYGHSRVFYGPRNVKFAIEAGHLANIVVGGQKYKPSDSGLDFFTTVLIAKK
ncbi:hypothetical protein PIIN_09957 [Serendipita indica DSM 11827]|uniref:Uncharacterized protein n=1 Tax=Serendipita indica (strain DSM 11827) TaxID=1109443 RepID=G4TXB8_SERID|nr:hypothetical protein PIIN_09957 [Serendipita indica DSM 11827]